MVGGRPVCQQETWLVHEDVHQPQNLDVQVIHATAERPLPAAATAEMWPPPPALCGLGPLNLRKQTHFADESASAIYCGASPSREVLENGYLAK